ncbi:hypothetical protein BKA69DRAFT_1163060 [Paraphysoderma sedebokerense]|nr:hypothetical protein BKA69DRAFT_1163060 [Paraphysoderma sedebokerense]
MTVAKSVDPELLRRWEQRLANLTELQLPTDYPRQTPIKIIEAEESIELPLSTCLSIIQLSISTPETSPVTEAATNGADRSADLSNLASPFQILLAAFSILLHRYTGEEDIAIGSSSVNFNPLVLRSNIKNTDTFKDVLRSIIKTEEDALSDEIPFSTLISHISDSHTDPNVSPPSLFKVRFFNLTDTNEHTISQSTASSTDITIIISQSQSLRRILSIDIKVAYNTTLYSHQRIRDMLEQLSLIIETAHQSPQTPVGQISLITKAMKSRLPDPTKHLEWDRWEGAIHEIFSRNARAHPDRVCVVENVEENGTKVERVFTYQQILEASNVVAHSLLKNGVEREDVVMLYSYRGVDLVIAVMGVLKAGCTFSVIDPAYPPKRQIIYLSVAKPRALVVLKKAGSIHPDVRSYIKTDLELKTEIPELEILTNGALRGSSNSPDILDAVRQLAKTDPEVAVGPDSIGTLSFTSGSTGIPKGVRGRHFSLTHFYPWMKSEFEMTEMERFTMLSGIAHDPIQRDIFTPLFLGAQLRIPTAEDIGSPGRLSQWMCQNQITITHLTPAMGQLLSANATHQILSLKLAFFVGDVLTKRDVLRLQHLAQNCSIINMYGTTETQRAVSYLPIPPSAKNPSFLTEQKDIMPAGRGMQNVQLLVVNPQGLLCGVGEVGEIYVRSGGLAEGYLQLDEVTAQKFIVNPFASQSKIPSKEIPHFRGPRDRMYRTGDLGRYRPDGNVECSGRADDQVKIRGFRIELGEIDTYLSQHPRIRENVTLVRRDKYEEQTLVSYIVPLGEKEGGVRAGDKKAIQEMIRDIREFLKTKLPGYSIPTVFVPLTRMPLTPNGKIDKNALPFPDTARFGSAATESDSQSGTDESHMSITEKSVNAIWMRLLGSSSSIPLDDNFFDLGGHSILATRLIFEIRKQMAVDVPLGLVFKEPTVRGMSKEIDKLVVQDLNLAGKAESATSLNEETPSTNQTRPPLHRSPSKDVLRHPQESEEPTYPYDKHIADLPDHVSPKNLPPLKFPITNPDTDNLLIFLTGATGFLGAFLVRDLLEKYKASTVVCLVRAKTDADGLKRLVDNCRAHGTWKEEYNGRVQAAVGDLAKDKFGLDDKLWNHLCEKVDFIIHNGALVHWVYPYSQLHGPNVLGTITSLTLSTTHHLKPCHFVSSTSVLDTEHYVRLIELEESMNTVLETDDLEGSRKGLRSGYGQTKWVAEKICMAAKERGCPVTIIRPGYIVGHSKSGVTNSDDFIWRLVKGCVELGQVPIMSNIVNMCSVDYVSLSTVEISSTPNSLSLGVFHMWNHHHFRFSDLFSQLAKYGYQVQPVEYIQWRTNLMNLTLSSTDNALFPLLHFVLDDLPTSTKAPMLDDRHTRSIVDGKVECPWMGDCMGIYLGYLVACGFLEKPKGQGSEELPEVKMDGLKVLGRSSRG